MTEVCDFSIAARIVDSSGAVVLDMNDHNAGYHLLRPIVLPTLGVKDIRTDAPRVDGSSQVAQAFTDGFLPLRVSVRGATWGEVETRWATLQGALYAETHYFVELEVEGRVRRWRTEWPNTDFGDVDPMALKNHWLTCQIAFRVQPNPTVTTV